MKKQMSLLIIGVVLLITGCNSATKDETLTHSLEVYGTTKGESGLSERLSKPIFTEADLKFVDLENFKFYFKDEYLKTFDVQTIIDEYNTHQISVVGLRIFSVGSGNGFEFVLDGEVLFTGEYAQGIASSHFPVGSVMYEEADGIRIVFVELNTNDIRKDSRLLDALIDLGITEALE